MHFKCKNLNTNNEWEFWQWWLGRGFKKIVKSISKPVVSAVKQAIGGIVPSKADHIPKPVVKISKPALSFKKALDGIFPSKADPISKSLLKISKPINKALDGIVTRNANPISKLK